MRKKLRSDVKVKGWFFPSHNGLVFHSGKFWQNHEEVRRVNNNGSVSLLLGGVKYGLKKLRADAQPCDVTIIDSVPF